MPKDHNPHKGHRKRLEEQVKSLTFLHEHQLIEYMLFGPITRRDVNVLAHMLNNKLGNAVSVMKNIDKAEIEGVGPATVEYFKLCSDVYDCIKSQDKPKLDLKMLDLLVDKCLKCVGIVVLYDSQRRISNIITDFNYEVIEQIAKCAIHESKFACYILNNEGWLDNTDEHINFAFSAQALDEMGFYIQDCIQVEKDKRLMQPNVRKPDELFTLKYYVVNLEPVDFTPGPCWYGVSPVECEDFDYFEWY